MAPVRSSQQENGPDIFVVAWIVRLDGQAKVMDVPGCHFELNAGHTILSLQTQHVRIQT